MLIGRMVPTVAMIGLCLSGAVSRSDSSIQQVEVRPAPEFVLSNSQRLSPAVPPLPCLQAGQSLAPRT